MPTAGRCVRFHALISILLTTVLCSCAPASDTSRFSAAAPASPVAGTDASTSTGGEAGSPIAGAPHVAPLETGLQLFRQGDLKGAEPYLAAAVRTAPRDRRILEMLGSIYARTDRPKQAEDSYRTALAIEPASIGARIGL